MAQRSVANFKATKESRYGDNTAGEISASDSRNMFEDVADSFVNWVDDVIDEDDMASDSPTKVPTQQSVKAYVDSQVGGSSFNLNLQFIEVEDFMVGQLPATGSPYMCALPFDFTWNGGESAPTISPSDYRVIEDHACGVVKITLDGTMATYRRYLKKMAPAYGNGNTVHMKWRVALSSVGDASDQFDAYVFIAARGVNTSGGPTGGLYFKYAYDENGGNWQAIANSGGTTTVEDTGVAADTVYHLFEIIINTDASSVQYLIDGVVVATITTNIQTYSMAVDVIGIGMEGGVTITNTITLNADWYALSVTNESGR